MANHEVDPADDLAPLPVLARAVVLVGARFWLGVLAALLVAFLDCPGMGR